MQIGLCIKAFAVVHFHSRCIDIHQGKFTKQLTVCRIRATESRIAVGIKVDLPL
jgi:hypothetical protein